MTKKTTPRDWHRARIIYELALCDITLAQIGRDQGYAQTSPYDVLRRRWAVMEKIVAGILGVSPAEIWPSRYPRNKRRV